MFIRQEFNRANSVDTWWV